MICTKCFTRMDACQDCADAELAKRDAEIERLRHALLFIEHNTTHSSPYKISEIARKALEAK